MENLVYIKKRENKLQDMVVLLSLLSLGICRSLCVSEGSPTFACVPGDRQPSFSLVVIPVQKRGKSRNAYTVFDSQNRYV